MKRAETPADRAKHRRATWSIALSRISDPVEATAVGTPESRLRAVEELTQECWALAGKRLPAYPRHEAPLRISRLATQGDGDT